MRKFVLPKEEAISNFPILCSFLFLSFLCILNVVLIILPKSFLTRKIITPALCIMTKLALSLFAGSKEILHILNTSRFLVDEISHKYVTSCEITVRKDHVQKSICVKRCLPRKHHQRSETASDLRGPFGFFLTGRFILSRRLSV